MSNLSSHHGSSEISNADESLRQAFMKKLKKTDFYTIWLKFNSNYSGVIRAGLPPGCPSKSDVEL